MDHIKITNQNRTEKEKDDLNNLKSFIGLERVEEAGGWEGQEVISLLHKGSGNLSALGRLGEMGK